MKPPPSATLGYYNSIRTIFQPTDDKVIHNITVVGCLTVPMSTLDVDIRYYDPSPPVGLLEYLQRVFYNTNHHMLPDGAHGLTWRRLKILCPQIYYVLWKKQQTALDPAIIDDLLFFGIHVVDYLFLPNCYRDLDFVQYQWFFLSCPQHNFPDIPFHWRQFFVYLQTPLFRENLRPILPPRLCYFQYYHPFNILELLSIPELCLSILSLKKNQKQNQYYHGPPKGACDQTNLDLLYIMISGIFFEV